MKRENRFSGFPQLLCNARSMATYKPLHMPLLSWGLYRRSERQRLEFGLALAVAAGDVACFDSSKWIRISTSLPGCSTHR